MIKCIRCNSLNFIFKSEHDFHDIFRCSDCLYLQPIRIEDCCKKSYLIVTIEHLDHTRKRLHRQCLNCGGCTDRNKPLSLKKYSEEIRSEFSYHNFEKWKEERGRESIYLRECVKKLNFDTSKYGKYNNYLNSHAWKLKRTEALFIDNNLCQVCKISAAEEVHHLTYENLFDEKLEDLLSVCKVCHDRLHNKS